MNGLWQSGDAPILSRRPLEGELSAQVTEINRQCLQLLADSARSSKQPIPDLVTQLRGLLRTMDRTALDAAAHCPLLLIDMAFHDPAWWRRVLLAPAKSLPAPAWLVPYPRQAAAQLTLATLMLAWHSVRTDLQAAIVILGLSAEVGELIRTLRLEDIAAIARAQSRHLRPRWEDCPAVWRHMLESTQHGNFRRDSSLRALQLASGNWAARR